MRRRTLTLLQFILALAGCVAYAAIRPAHISAGVEEQRGRPQINFAIQGKAGDLKRRQYLRTAVLADDYSKVLLSSISASNQAHKKEEKQHMKIVAIILGLFGSIVSIYSASSALVTVGGDLAYSSRLWAGWAAFTLAILAAVAAAFTATRPHAASIVMLIGGLAGFACINLFYINSFYAFALPFWVVGAVLAWLAGKASTTQAMRREA